MKFHKVSIIIPVYNIAPYLKECIESVIAQSYSNIEIIIVDDGSTDGSSFICDEYAIKDSRIIVVHKINGGLVSARQEGLKKATGDFVTFVDGDDYVDANYVKNLYKGIATSDADVVVGGYYELGKYNNKKISVCNEDTIIDYPKNNMELWKSILLCEKHTVLFIRSVCQKMFKKDVIVKSYSTVPVECSYGEDFLTAVEYMFNINRIMFIPCENYYYRAYRDGSYTNDKSVVALYNNLKLIQQLKIVFNRHSYLDIVSKLLAQCSVINLVSAIEKMTKKRFNNYLYKNYQHFFGKNIVLYAAGKVGYDYYCQLSKYSKINIIGWIDKNYTRYNYEEFKIQPVDYINDIEFDYILISIADKNMAKSIKTDLCDKYNIDSTKILWETPVRELDRIVLSSEN